MDQKQKIPNDQLIQFGYWVDHLKVHSGLKIGRGSWIPQNRNTITTFTIGSSIYFIATNQDHDSILNSVVLKMTFSNLILSVALHPSGRFVSIAFQNKKNLIFDLDAPMEPRSEENEAKLIQSFHCIHETICAKKVTNMLWVSENKLITTDKFGTLNLSTFFIDATVRPSLCQITLSKPTTKLGHCSIITDILIAESTDFNLQNQFPKSLNPIISDPLQSYSHSSHLISTVDNSSIDISTQKQQWVITSDRDEKIRVSKWPQAYDIQSYCLGHEQFVSCLCLVQSKDHGLDYLLSAGGDSQLFAWDYTKGEKMDKINLFDQVVQSEFSRNWRIKNGVTQTVVTSMVYHVATNLIIMNIEYLDALLFYRLTREKELDQGRSDLIKNQSLNLEFVAQISIPMTPLKISIDPYHRLWMAGIPVEHGDDKERITVALGKGKGEEAILVGEIECYPKNSTASSSPAGKVDKNDPYTTPSKYPSLALKFIDVDWESGILHKDKNSSGLDRMTRSEIEKMIEPLQREKNWKKYQHSNRRDLQN